MEVQTLFQLQFHVQKTTITTTTTTKKKQKKTNRVCNDQ